MVGCITKSWNEDFTKKLFNQKSKSGMAWYLLELAGSVLTTGENNKEFLP